MTAAPLLTADAVATAKVAMPPAERLLLFSLVRALRPVRVLQIGIGEGGAATIIVAALDEVGAGTLVCVDPVPRVSDADWARLAHRATILTGRTAALRDEVHAVAGGLFGLVFVASERRGVELAADLDVVADLLTEGAHLLVQDALDGDGAQAIEALTTRGRRFVDCGALSAARDAGALRLLRYVGEPAPVMAPARANGAGFAVDELARVIAETTQLDAASAARAARGLADPTAFPVDYVAECKALWKESPADFVAGLYRIILSREADPSGVAYHVARLKAGDSRLDVVRTLAASEEAREKGIRTEWIDQLAAASASFPVAVPWVNGTWNRRLRSWVRRQPALARAARYAMVAGRTPWTVERLHALVAEQQQGLEKQRRQIERLERRVGADVEPNEAASLDARLSALAGQVERQNGTLARLLDAVERLARGAAPRRD